MKKENIGLLFYGSVGSGKTYLACSIANSLIHQDLYITGAAPVVEIFDNRIEVTNPGIPLVDVLRIIDNPPKSRNEKLASLMRRLKMCEELGRGWDRMVSLKKEKALEKSREQIKKLRQNSGIFLEQSRWQHLYLKRMHRNL